MVLDRATPWYPEFWKNEVRKLVSVGAATKKTFYWEDLRCQDLDSGFKMYKKYFVEKRNSKTCWEPPFGGSGSQEVLARVGPWKPGPGLNARDCACVWICMCTSFFFFFQKAFRCAVGARHTRHVCCLRFVYLVVLLCKENNNLVKLFFLGCIFNIAMAWILRFYFFF